MGIFPTTDIADRGIEIAIDLQDLRPSESVFAIWPREDADAIHGRLNYGFGRAELGVSFATIDNGVWDGDGFGYHGKLRLLEEGADAPVGFAIGFQWNEMDPVVNATASYFLEDWKWLRIYAAISKTLAEGSPKVRGHIGVAWDELRARWFNTSTSPSTFGASNTASEFNLFAGLDVTVDQWNASVEWGSRAFAATGGFALPDRIFVVDNESVWAVTIRYALSQDFTWQGGYTNALGPFPVGLQEARWFTGLRWRFGGRY